MTRLLALLLSSGALSCNAPARHVVGTAGEPPYNTAAGWDGSAQGSRFWRQADGTVFLELGLNNQSVTAATSGTVFTLPADYRPKGFVQGVAHWTSNISTAGGSALVQVAPSGDVSLVKDPDSTSVYGPVYGSVTFHAED